MQDFPIEFNAAAMDVTTDEFSLKVALVDGREISVPLEYFPRLRDATPEQLKGWKLIGRGDGITWEELDEDISVRSLLRLH